MTVQLETLKKRAEFLRVRGGSRWSAPSFTLEGKPRVEASASGDHEGPARFGFTVTKKLGGAVVRNRIRRRLKSAVSEIGPTFAKPGFDYVIIARPPALTQPYAAIKKELEDAFHRVHHPRRDKRPTPSGGERRNENAADVAPKSLSSRPSPPDNRHPRRR